MSRYNASGSTGEGDGDGKDQNYSDTQNPFNDMYLSQKFVWSKKRPADRKLDPEEQERRESQRRQEAEQELERIRLQRQQREQERQWMDQERERLAREKERAALGNWEEREERFHLDNAKRRAAVRIRERRPTVMDLLVMNININDIPKVFTGCDLMVDEPYLVFRGLGCGDMELLLQEMESFKRLESSPEHQNYWQCLIDLAKDEVQKLKLIEARGRKSFRAEELIKLTSAAFAPSAAMADDILRDIFKLLGSKSPAELEKLNLSVERKLNGGGAIDVDYWETLRSALQVFRTRAQIRRIHENILEKRLEFLKAHPAEAEAVEETQAAATKESESAGGLSAHVMPAVDEPAHRVSRPGGQSMEERLQEPINPAEIEDQELIQRVREELRGGSGGDETGDGNKKQASTANSNRSKSTERGPYGGDAETKDERNIRQAKSRILNQVADAASRLQGVEMVRFDTSKDAERQFILEAQREMDSDEEDFDKSLIIPDSIMDHQYMWQDKYRPRKPRYYNRVHTGYDWNKYNRTHYDENNPPPKTVQGYKFNIFYPDLIDPSKAPTYHLLPDPDPESRDTIILRFSAGPPYEDIAFRILNNEWETNYRRGFKCCFERGVLQLWFRFKRSR